MPEGQRRHTINWGQAFAEVILIVIGVALALAADDWADVRQELAEEQAYLVRLRADFEATRESLENSLAEIQANIDVKLRLMELLQDPDSVILDEQLSEMIRESFYMQLPNVSLATYADMINSGDLRLLRNASLRLGLAEFDGKWRDYQSVLAEGFQQWNQVHVPFLISKASVPSIYSAGYLGVDLPGSDRPIDRSTIWSQEFANILAISIISRQDMLVMGEMLLGQVTEILGLIDGSIE